MTISSSSRPGRGREHAAAQQPLCRHRRRLLLRQRRQRVGERAPVQPVGFDAFGEELARVRDHLAGAADLFYRPRQDLLILRK